MIYKMFFFIMAVFQHVLANANGYVVGSNEFKILFSVFYNYK